MIDPMSAFAAVSAASSAISSAIKAGKDLSSLSGQVSKYAKAEAELNFGASRKKKGMFSKLTGVEQSGIDEFFRKEELDTLRDEMRSIFMLYGKKGAWERLQAEIARQRAEQKKALEEQAKRKEKIVIGVTVTIIATVAITGMTLWVMYLKG
jgi:multidrug resistance efflux pump